MKDTKDIPRLLLEITKTGLAEDVLLGMQDKPEWMKGYIFVMTYVTGDDPEEIEQNIKIFKKVYKKGNARFMKPPDRMRNTYLEKPIFAAGAADYRKGGGFEYVGAFMPLEKVPEAYNRAAEISRKHNIPPTIGSRLISGTHTIVVFFSYSFNRADQKDMENARKALHETDELALELGGIPWKVELDGQHLVLNKIDPSYKKALKLVKNALDPNNIMNPGNWEVTEK